MTDQPAESTEAAASSPTDLLDNLRELGEALPVSFQPNAHTSGPLLAGLIYYVATGSLVAPRVDTPNQAEINAELAETTRINEAEAKVAELERQLSAQGAGAAPVVPAPVAPVEPAPTPPLDVAPPAAVEPGPAPTPPQVDPATAAPVAPDGTVGS